MVPSPAIGTVTQPTTPPFLFSARGTGALYFVSIGRFRALPFQRIGINIDWVVASRGGFQAVRSQIDSPEAKMISY